MVRTRQAKVDAIAKSLPPTEVDDPGAESGQGARMLVVGWGSTYGPIGAAVRRVRRDGLKVAQAHLRHLYPMPSDIGDILRGYDRVVVPEMNLGQLALLLRGRYLVDAKSHTQVNGMPFKAAELADVLRGYLAALGDEIPEPRGMHEEVPV
jgi:2-oxoglutarate ferredoxin oxidoreductase subunit alpha